MFSLKKVLKLSVRHPLETLATLILWGFFLGLGRSLSVRLSGFLGRKLGFFLRKKTALAFRNLQRAFPEKSPQEIEGIVEKMWENLGRIPAEYAHFYSFSIHDPHLCEIVGQEHLDALKTDNKPGILIAGHLANWGIVSMATLQAGLPITQIYRRFNNKSVDWIINKVQYQGGMKTLWKGADGGKQALHLLKKGHHLVLFVDQKLKEGLPIPFFGRPALTAPAIARLSLKFQCPLVPVRVERREGLKFRVTYYPPLEAHPSLDKHQGIEHLLTKMNLLLESWIREKPEEWLWVHNRWG